MISAPLYKPWKHTQRTFDASAGSQGIDGVLREVRQIGRFRICDCKHSVVTVASVVLEARLPREASLSSL